MDYGKVSRRWMMREKYYTKVFDHKGTTLRVVFLDTTPLIDSYRKASVKYPDACKQDVEEQLRWLDATLQSAQEDWVVVVGHHPIYAETKKEIAEQEAMQQRVLPILHRYQKKVAMYVCGHIHNFQYITRPSDPIAYVVNSAGALSRKVKATEGTQFCSPATGFAVLSATKQELCLHMIDKEGKALYSVKQTR